MRHRLTQGFAPKMRTLPPKKSGIVGVLDIGTSKVVCAIARLTPRATSDVLGRRTHSVDVLGIGHTRAHGIKGGVVVDMAKAELAIRQAVDMAERASGAEIASAVVGGAGGGWNDAVRARRRRARPGRDRGLVGRTARRGRAAARRRRLGPGC